MRKLLLNSFFIAAIFFSGLCIGWVAAYVHLSLPVEPMGDDEREARARFLIDRAKSRLSDDATKN